MKKYFTLVLLSTLTLSHYSASAWGTDETSLETRTYLADDLTIAKPSRIYTTTAMEGYILSTSMLSKPGQDDKLTTPRLSAFLHLGTNVNIDFNYNVGMITGLGIRNIGFIEKYDGGDSTVKRRIYGLNLPVLFKFGNMPSRNYFFAGAEFTMAFNYKEKGFVKRNKKEKFNEWFSDRTPLFHPSIAAGYQSKYGYLKFNYYLSNFLNPDFTTKDNVRPYEGYNVNLMTLSFGFNFPMKKSFYDFPKMSALR